MPWQHYGDSLPSKVNRTSRGTNTPKQKYLEDILEGIKVLDETVDTLLIKFCAIHLNNLPAKCDPGNPSDMRTRISTWESQMTEILSFKQNTLKETEIIKPHDIKFLMAMIKEVIEGKSTTEKV